MAKTILPVLVKIDNLRPIEAMMGDLTPLKRRRLAPLLTAIRNFYQEPGNRSAAEKMYTSDEQRFQTLRILLSHIEKAATAFAPELEELFAERSKAPVDHSLLADTLEYIIDKSEKNEPNS